jgi:hypothetical protein
MDIAPSYNFGTSSNFYNKERFHQSLANKIPWDVYSAGTVKELQALLH